ncbi:hypothetical protein AM499_17395 [Bacillus sp. FJAT-22090]|uniref:tyrosine-type recombinase/integrase n=1 Tax=Bacillus sp. FJAT-22090 TaxID=1581038 RepID=UPI0006ADF40C|nr:tyrosine-type recombinase/integrase [Bacillus sp. FJAT-22090]ALC87390.1 hypothetical protein AM499_17395 [Bacillus sp. FJAT-22090]
MTKYPHSNMSVLLKQWKNKVINITNLSKLDKKLSLAGKKETLLFHDFDDIEMIQVYLYRQRQSNVQEVWSERTIKVYRDELVLFVEHLISYGQEFDFDVDANTVIDTSLIKSLTTMNIRKYQEWLIESSPYVKKRGSYAPATLSRKVGVIRSFLYFLYEKQYINYSIHQGLLICSNIQEERPNRELGPYEVVQLLNYFRENNHYVTFSIIHILIATGLKNGEFCRLKVKDLIYNSNYKENCLVVKGKGSKIREVPIKEKAYNSLVLFRTERGLEDIDVAEPESPLFTTSNGKAYSPSYLTQFLSKEIQQSELPILSQGNIVLGALTFRHTFALISKINNIDFYEIHRLLGNDSIETTSNYMEKIFPIENNAVNSWKSEILGGFI